MTKGWVGEEGRGRAGVQTYKIEENRGVDEGRVEVTWSKAGKWGWCAVLGIRRRENFVGSVLVKAARGSEVGRESEGWSAKSGAPRQGVRGRVFNGGQCTMNKRRLFTFYLKIVREGGLCVSFVLIV